MRSILANLRTLVLPAGATTGARIVLDGVNGVITIYNAFDVIVAQIDADGFQAFDETAGPGADTARLGAGQLFLATNNAEESEAAVLTASTVGLNSDDSIRGILTIESAEFAQGSAAIHLVSESVNATTVPQPVISFDELGAVPQTPVDICVNASTGTGGRSLGQGILRGGFFEDTTDDSSRAAGADTDMTITPTDTIRAGRAYRFYVHGQLNADATAGNHFLTLEHDGTMIAVLDNLQASEVKIVNEHYLYRPSSDDSSATFTLANHAGSAGSLQFIAQSDNRRQFYVEDAGRVDR